MIVQSSEEGARFTIAFREAETCDRVPEPATSPGGTAPWVEVVEAEDGNGQFQEEPARQ
jgi:hypothetical protein